MTVGSSIPLFSVINLPNVVFLVIVLSMILLPMIKKVGMAVVLFVFMLIPIHLGMGLFEEF
jgi:hypothetical protein